MLMRSHTIYGHARVQGFAFRDQGLYITQYMVMQGRQRGLVGVFVGLIYHTEVVTEVSLMTW